MLSLLADPPAASFEPRPQTRPSTHWQDLPRRAAASHLHSSPPPPPAWPRRRGQQVVFGNDVGETVKGRDSEGEGADSIHPAGGHDRSDARHSRSEAGRKGQLVPNSQQNTPEGKDVRLGELHILTARVQDSNSGHRSVK